MNAISPSAVSTQYFMPTYGPPSATFVKGRNAELFDVNGKRYIDLLAGIAVVSVGHCNPLVTDTITRQAGELVHTSNLYQNVPGCQLSQKLHELAGNWGQVFLANSGTEANECALKLARKWGAPSKTKIVAAVNSFHGRTFGALAATGQPAKWEGYHPLPAGFSHAPYNDLAAFEALIDDQTAAVIVEPIQGEGGIVEANRYFLQGLRDLCTKRECLLIFDEIQCGVGRTGSWWGFHHYGVIPDIFTSAKGLGNGFPIGACIAAEWIADSFRPGDHGTTFGGNPLASAVALSVISVIENTQLLPEVKRKGEVFASIMKDGKGVRSIRGVGLMRGLELAHDKSKEVAVEALKRGLIVNSVRPNILRITPPLTIEEPILREGCAILLQVLEELVI